MPDVPIQVTPTTLYLPQFGLEVPVMRVSGKGEYFPMRPLCKALGLASQPQVDRIQDDPDFEDGVEIFNVPTPGGRQDSVCLRKREVAWWLGTLDPRTRQRLEARFNTTLAEFKRALMDAADRLWWGVADVPADRALVVAEPAGAFHLHCRRCRARHRLELRNGEVLWEIEE